MAASPAASDGRTDQSKKIAFQFCNECSNLLYPREDRVNNVLMYACKTCQQSVPAESSCVYRNDLSNTVGETAGITQDVSQDPTVGGLVHTSVSQYNEGSVASDEHGAEGLAVPTLCTMCGQPIFCTVCGEGIGAPYVLEAEDEGSDHGQDNEMETHRHGAQEGHEDAHS